MTMNITAQMIAELFKLKGGESDKAQLFETLGAAEQSQLARRAMLESDEEPAVAWINSEEDWCLVTTRRLIWADSAGPHSIELLDLDSVEPDRMSALKRRLTDTGVAKRGWKLDIDRLHVQTVDGRRVTISLQAGESFLTMWNTLRRLCHWAQDWRGGRRWWHERTSKTPIGINADAQIVTSVFMRNGGEGKKTKLFENLTPSEKRGFTEMADLRPSEEIVITFYDTESDWCLITTQRLIWATAGERQEMELLNLDSFDDDMEEAFQRTLSRPDPDARNPKLDMREIRPVTLDGRRAKIEIEPGQTYWGFYNALQWLCHWFRVRGRPAAQAVSEAGANGDETS